MARVGLLVINDEEARLLSGEHNVVRAARKLDVATPNLDAIYAIATMVAGKGPQGL